MKRIIRTYRRARARREEKRLSDTRDMLLAAGWDEERAYHAVICAATGIGANKNEPALDHLARATGTSVATVEEFVGLLKRGYNPREADRKLFETTPSKLCVVLAAISAGVQASAELVEALQKKGQRA